MLIDSWNGAWNGERGEEKGAGFLEKKKLPHPAGYRYIFHAC